LTTPKKVRGLRWVDLPEKYTVDDVLVMMREKVSHGELKGYNEVMAVNGLNGMSGFNFLVGLRGVMEQQLLGAQMVVVKTHEYLVRFGGVGKLGIYDFVRARRNYGGVMRIEYWYEFMDSKSNAPIVDRKNTMMFEASAYVVDGEDDMIGELKVMFPCAKQEYDELTKRISESDSVRISGMLIDVSKNKKGDLTNYFVVQEYEIVEQDYSKANIILEKLKHWQTLIPMRHYETADPLFPETTCLAMMAAVLFTRRGVPAFNAIMFGPSAGGKTSLLRFFVEDLMGGSIESATASSGKGWLVSHKEGVPPSKLFTEKRVLLVDEMLKSVTTNQRMNAHSYAVELKAFLQKHMQIFDREEVSASSGVGVVKGRMVCSFIGTENDDETLIKALGRAEVMSEAAMRRIQIGYAERENTRVDEDVNPLLAKRKQMSMFYRLFGREVKKAMQALYLYSRRFTEDMSLEAPKEWKARVRELIVSEASIGVIGYPRWLMGDDVKMKRKFMQFIDLHLKGLLTPCYVSAAVMRGWEVYSSIEELRPVFDEEQSLMAEGLVLFFLKSKLKILAPGIEQALTGEEGGVQRSLYGEGGI